MRGTVVKRFPVKTVLATTVAGVALSAALSAQATVAWQEEQVAEVGEIVVTGTRIRRVQTSTSAPVVNVGRVRSYPSCRGPVSRRQAQGRVG